MSRNRKVKNPRKRVLVPPSEVNAFIKANAAKAANWSVLSDMLFDAHGVRVETGAIRQRGLRLGVTTQAKRLRTSPALAQVADPLERGLMDILRKRKTLQTVETLADSLDVAPARVRTAMEQLRAGGHNLTIISGAVELSRDIPKAEPLRIDARKLDGKVFKFGYTTDNHLGSKYERMDVLEALYDTWEKQGVKIVYQTGNMIDGEARFNKFELHTHGMEGQARYFARKWPKRRGIVTQFITGDDHEGWYVQREGVNIGQYLEDTAKKEGREDLKYLGHMEHDIFFEGKKQASVMRLIHPGGGSAYATSYTQQKLAESFQGGEKPHVMLIGHYHKAEYGYPREIHALQGGCTMDQSPFMRKKRLSAHVGGWTVEMTINPDGIITRFRTEWMPFFDRDFYDKKWSYRGLAA